MMLALTSCVDEHYEVVETIYVDSHTEYSTVTTDRWRKYDQPNDLESSNWSYFYYDLNVPKLTNEVFDYGIMNAYLTMGSKSKVSPLPFDDFYLDHNDNNHRWTEQVTCEFAPGRVRFIVKYNDFSLDVPPYDYTFMIRFMW